MTYDESDWRKPNSWQRAFWGDLVDDPQFQQKARGPVDWERRVRACRETLGAACPANNERIATMSLTRTKDKGMTVYEALSRDLDAVEDHVMDLYVQSRDDEALAAATALKDFAVRVRYKAAPGMTTIEVPTELASEISALRAQLGDAPLAQWLRQARGGQSTGGAKLADDEKAAASFKAERDMGLDPNGLRFDDGRLVGAPPALAPAVVTTKAAAGDGIGQIARQTMPGLYETKGKKR